MLETNIQQDIAKHMRSYQGFPMQKIARPDYLIFNKSKGNKTFVRATDATYTDENGDLQIAAANEDRWQNDIGYFGEPASTNKCINYNANPDSGAVTPTTVAAFNAATTNLTAFDTGSGCLFGIVDGTSAIAAAGLSAICTSNLLLKIDNSGGSGVGVIDVGGSVTNTNPHSLSAWVMAESGSTPLIQLNGGGGSTSTTNTSLTRISLANETPGATSWVFRHRVEIGEVGYFILSQLEESAFSTSEIITEGNAVTRNKDDLSYPTTYIPANDCVFSFDWTPTAAGQGTILLFSLGVVTDFIAIFHDGASIRFRKTLLSTNYDGAKTLTYVAGTTYKIKCRLSSTDGVDIWIDDVIGTNNSNTDDAIIAGTLNIGSHYNLAAHQTGGIKNFAVHPGNFSDAEVVGL